MLKKTILLSLIAILAITYNTIAQDNIAISNIDTAEINNSITYVKKNIYIIPDKLAPSLDSIILSSQKLNYPLGLFEGHNLKGISYWMVEDFENAFSYYKKALEYSSLLSSPRKKAIVLSNIGMSYTNLFKLDSAEYYLKKSIAFCMENQVTDLELKTKFDLGGLYLQQDRYIDAIKLLYQVKDSLKVHDNKYLELVLYSTMGVLYTNIGKTELAIESYKESIAIDNELEDIDYKSSNYVNMGETFFQAKEYDSAIFYFNKALDVSLPYSKDRTTLAVNVSLGNIFLTNNQLDSCYVYYQKAFADSLLYTQPENLAATTVDMGLYYAAIKEYTKSKEYLVSGLQMTRDLNLVRFERNALQSLSKIDSIAGDFESAYKYLSAFNITEVQLAKNEAQLAIKALEFDNYLSIQKLHTHNLEHENEIQAKKIKTKNIVIAAIIAIVLLLLILFYSSYRSRLATKKLVVQLSEKNKDLKHLNSDINATNLLLEQNEAKLQKSNLTKDKFFSILGHDLKSPFNSLLGLLDIIDSQWNEMEDSKKHFLIKKLYSSSQQTYTLLENVLTWGKAQRGQINCKKESFKLIETVQSIIDLYQSKALSKEIELTSSVDSNTYLNTDIMLLNQIIQNFVNNAIKFTPKGGKVNIESTVKTNSVLICVTDNGIGIPSSEIERIFSLEASYYRPGTEDEKSTGMGLILTSEYASIINGTLSVKSTEFKGSSFCLEVPKA